jgi:hypothetical protein
LVPLLNKLMKVLPYNDILITTTTCLIGEGLIYAEI